MSARTSRRESVSRDSSDSEDDDVSVSSMSSFFAGVPAPANQPAAAQQPPSSQPPRTNGAPVANGQMRPAGLVRTNSGGGAPGGPNGARPAGPPTNGPPSNGPPSASQQQRPAPQRVGSGGPMQFQAQRPGGNPVGQQQRPMNPNPANPNQPRPANPNQQPSALNPSAQPLQQRPPQQRLSGGPPPKTANLSQSVLLGESPATSPSGGGEADEELARVVAEYRAYKRTTQEELETAKRSRVSLQNQLKESQNSHQEAMRALSEQSSRVMELQAALQKSRAAAETELNFFNLEVEKEIARSKTDKEKLKLQATLASYEDAHQKNKKIIETLNGEIIKLKQAYKAVLNGGTPPIGITSGNSTEVRTLRADVARLTATEAELRAALEAQTTVAAAAAATPTPAAQTEFQIHLEEWRRRADEANAQLADLKASQATHAGDAEITSQEVQQRVETLDEEKKTAVEALAQANAKLQQVSADLKLAQTRVSESQATVVGLESRLESASQELALLRTSNGESDAQSQRVDELSSHLATLQSESSITIAAKDQQLHELQATLDEANTRTQAATKQVEDLRASLAKAHEAVKTKTQELNASVARCTGLEEEQTQLRASIETLTTELSSAQSSLTSTTASLVASVATVAELREQQTSQSTQHESQLRERWSQIAELQKVCATLTESLEQAKLKATDARTAFDITIADLKSQLVSQVASSRTALEAASAEATHNDTLRVAEITALQQQLQTAEANLASETQRFALEEQRFTQEEATLQSALTAERAQLTKLAREREVEVADLTSQLQALHTAHESTKEQHRKFVATSEKNIASLMSDIAGLRAQLATKCTEFDTLTTRTTAELADLAGQIERFERRCMELQTVLRNKTAALAAYHEQIAFNARRREEALRNTPVKKPSLLDSIAKKLHIGDATTQREDAAIDMFLTNADGSAPRNDELAEEVAISLAKRLQQSESARVALENDLTRLRGSSARPSAASTPGRR